LRRVGSQNSRAGGGGRHRTEKLWSGSLDGTRRQARPIRLPRGVLLGFSQRSIAWRTGGAVCKPTGSLRLDFTNSATRQVLERRAVSRRRCPHFPEPLITTGPSYQSAALSHCPTHYTTRTAAQHRHRPKNVRTRRRPHNILRIAFQNSLGQSRPLASPRSANCAISPAGWWSRSPLSRDPQSAGPRL
jgi:hypothetical protein